MSGLLRGTGEIYCQIPISVQCTVIESSRSMTRNALISQIVMWVVWIEACKHQLQNCHTVSTFVWICKSQRKIQDSCSTDITIQLAECMG